MIDAVSTLSGLSTALRSSSQAAPVSSLPSLATSPNYGGSRIYVNNLQNVAVLQDLDASGKVTAQYPTQSQIQAFITAERLAADQQQAARETAPAASSPQASSNTTGASTTASTTASTAAPATPSVSNILEAMTTASYTSTGAASASSAQSSTQSVDA